MLLTALILCYALGLSVLFAISRKYSLAELLGYTFLLGIGIESVFLFLLDVLNIRFSPRLILGLNVASIILICGLNFKNLVQIKNEFRFPKFTLKDVNLAAILIFCFGAYLLYAVTVKNLFWPTNEHDSIGTFDKLGKIMAIEGRLKISLFQYHLEGAGGIYPPLYHSSLAFAYIFGALTGKIITTLFFISLIASFYGLLRKYLDSTASMLFTFLLMISPELFSHAALSLDNMPTTAYAGTGAIATLIWLDKRERKYFWLGAILLAFSIWIRSDTIVFPAAAVLLIAIDFLKNKNWKNALLYAAMVFAPFVIWTLYLKYKINLSQGARFDFSVGYNAQRFSLLTGYVKAYLFGGDYGRIDGGQLFGLSFILFFIMIIVNVLLMFKAGVKKIMGHEWQLLLFFFTALFGYAAIFYLINDKTQGSPLYSLMESSFKRGLFCFIPIALFYSATNYASAWLFAKVEKFRNTG